MLETLLPIDLPQGISRNGTDYQSKGRWHDANFVRFWNNAKMPIGGWRVATGATGTALAALSGVPRAAISWRADAGDAYVAFATTSHLTLLAGGATYDITPSGFVTGRTDAAFASGAGLYGANAYGVGPYGTGSLASSLNDADTWTLDVFGQYLAGVSTSDKKLYVWQGDTASAAAVPAGAPTTANAVVVTPERFLFALGASGVARRVAWPSQETVDDWTPSDSNTAGDFDLTTNGKLVCGQRTVAETLLWTDIDLHAARYIGGTLLYSFQQVGDGCGIIAPNAKVVLESQAYWMGARSFYVYNGYVQQIACDVADYVFSDFNYTQKSKVFAFANPQYSEIWWFYPSASSSANNRYVVYNYAEQHWTIGTLAREAGIGPGATATPILCNAAGSIYEHETGNTRDSAAFLSSGPIELGNGERVMHIHRLVPDEDTLGQVELTLATKMWPTDADHVVGTFALNTPTDIRASGVLARVTFVETPTTTPASWRVGTMKLGVRQGGRRGGSRAPLPPAVVGGVVTPLAFVLDSTPNTVGVITTTTISPRSASEALSVGTIARSVIAPRSAVEIVGGTAVASVDALTPSPFSVDSPVNLTTTITPRSASET